jgi:predicted dienelactone hydrolase
VKPAVLHLEDPARGRALPTDIYVPASGRDAPLVVFCHGFLGHPRKFTRLFSQWADAGYLVAAPTFPHTNDAKPPPHLIDDVANQPADVSFVIDELLARGLGDPARVGVGGYSLGAETALAVALHPTYADERVRAVCAFAGGLYHPDFATDVLRPLPLLLVHGADDTKRGRLEAAVAVYDAAHEPKEFVTLEGAGHHICQDGAPHAARVAALTTAFWARYLRP